MLYSQLLCKKKQGGVQKYNVQQGKSVICIKRLCPLMSSSWNSGGLKRGFKKLKSKFGTLSLESEKLCVNGGSLN